MTITLKLYGSLKDKMPKGYKQNHHIEASSIFEIISYLKQFPSIATDLETMKYEVRIGSTFKNSHFLTADDLVKVKLEDTTIHIAPVIGGADFITGATLLAALISAAVSIVVSIAISLLFPPPSTDPTEDRKSKLYAGGLVTQKEGVPLNYIAGLDVLCGSNLIEGSIDYTKSGNSGSFFNPNDPSYWYNYNYGIFGGSFYESDGYYDLRYGIYGAKGGGGGGNTISNTIYTDATLRALLALGVGPIGGIIGDTQEEKEQNIFINELPLRDPASGQLQYQGVQWEERYGEVGQSAIKLTPNISNNFDLNVEFTAGDALIYEVTDESVDQVKMRVQVDALVSSDKQGNQYTTTVAFNIDHKKDSDAGWTYLGQWSYTGKSSDSFVLERTINRPVDSLDDGWSFRITRVTPDSTDDLLQNGTHFNGYIEYQLVELTYDGTAYTHNGTTQPGSGVPTALFGAAIDLTQFTAGSLPQVAVRARGQKVRVPTNYNPITKAYTGTWDGTWKYEATENPVWHWFNIATMPIVGMGIPSTSFDKFALYAVAQYNDQNVNGRTRFTLNKQFTDVTDAWPFLVELASSFRCAPYYNGVQYVLSQDRPITAPSHYINNTMVENGWFNYTTNELTTQFNEILGEWDDPDDFFRKKVVRYRQEDDIAANNSQGMANGGVITQTYYKIGCVNEQECYDFCRILCYDSLNELENVEFTTMANAAAIIPGQIFAVDDIHTSGKKATGRLVSVLSGTTLKLDVPVTLTASHQYDIWAVVNNQLVIRPLAIPGSTVTTDTITISSTTDMDAELPYGIVDRAGVQPKWFKCLEIVDVGGAKFTVRGREYDQGKHEWIDDNVPVPVIVYTEYNTNAIIPAPTGLQVTHQFGMDDLGVPIHSLTFSWAPVPNVNNMNYLISGYVADVLSPLGHWDRIYDGNLNTTILRNPTSGKYIFTVKAVNTFGKSSEIASIEYNFNYGGGDAPYPPIFIDFD